MTTANVGTTYQLGPQLAIHCVTKAVIGDTILVLLMLATLIL